MKWFVVCRTVDGRYHFEGEFNSREEAVAYLVSAAEECLGSHRRVEFCEGEELLITSYAGDDQVTTFVVGEDELAYYEVG